MRTMRTYITYHEEKIEAIILGSNKVGITQQDDGCEGRIRGSGLIELDECLGCGKWCSEDEGLYGDGYCDGCAEMCCGCQCYFNRKDMTLVGDEVYVCNECKDKL